MEFDVVEGEKVSISWVYSSVKSALKQKASNHRENVFPREQRQLTSLVQEASQFREASTPQTETATGATHGGGALPAAETTQRTTRATKASPAVAVATRAERGERTPPREKRNNSRADQVTLADGATRHTLYVDATAVGPRTPTHHAER